MVALMSGGPSCLSAKVPTPVLNVTVSSSSQSLVDGHGIWLRLPSDARTLVTTLPSAGPRATAGWWIPPFDPSAVERSIVQSGDPSRGN